MTFSQTNHHFWNHNTCDFEEDLCDFDDFVFFLLRSLFVTIIDIDSETDNLISDSESGISFLIMSSFILNNTLSFPVM